VPKSLEDLRKQLREGIDARDPKDLRKEGKGSIYDEDTVETRSSGLVDDPLADFEDAEPEKEWGTPRWTGTLPEVVERVKAEAGPIKGRHADLIIVDDVIGDGKRLVGKASLPGVEGEFEVHLTEGELEAVKRGDIKGVSIGGSAKLPKKAKRKKGKGMDLSAMRASKRTTPGGSARRFHSSKYTISEDGCDAVLNFGKHAGASVSHLARTEPGYLRWMQGEDFPPDLMDVIGFVLDGPATVDRKMKRKRR